MIVTNRDKEYLHTLLWANVNFQETYNEVYDHIMTAMEAAPETGLSAYQYLDIIIARDFGTIAILKDMENERIKVITVHMKKRLWSYMLGYFKLPSILFTLCATGLAYVMTSYIPCANIFWIMAAVALIPGLVHFKRVMKNVYFRKTQKASVKDGGIVSMHYIFTFFTFSFFQILYSSDYALLYELPVFAVTIIFMYFLMYALSYIKVYNDEFKVQIVK
jgi:hypothetical protein